ncbi:solute carrier family 22 member 4-like isoform X2 [Mercenaria mercenaria]|uniref:solute carrier family 22 member 4-like isoform X2 n=1 Tax=Mercenaria mercenaria TaxID=6596 RepID=UPI00234ECCB3|nr:solute carrier family 22 member 4-like isoform X2 [Mercenaria mercenaria]
MVVVFNFVGFMSTNWIMFSVSRFFIGFGAGDFISVQHCILSEIMLAKWRPWITGFPSWPIQVCALAFISWLIKDWRYIQLFCCLLGIPFLFTWFIIPESFRWFVAHDRLADAKNIIERWAKMNRKPVPELDNIMVCDDSETKESEKKYTFIHLFKSKALTKITLLLAINWLALGMVFYAITFGIQALSGNIYLNLFLFSLAGIPTKVVALWLQNRLGRRISNVLCFILVAASGFIVGVVQSIDASNKEILTNVFSIIASVGINTAWGPVQTMTIEVYPTVVRMPTCPD